jgi:hypothetical protein
MNACLNSSPPPFKAGYYVRIASFCGHLGLRRFSGCTGVVLPEDEYETAQRLQSIRLNGSEELVITVPVTCLVYAGSQA